MTDILEDFIAAMTKYGCAPAHVSDIKPTGKWERFDIAGERKNSKTGFYRLTIDGDFGFGNFGDRKVGETQDWHSKGSRKFTDEEKVAWQKRIEAEKAAAEQERSMEQQNVARQARAAWDQCMIADADHPYLRKKKIGVHGARVNADGDLLVPMYADGKLWAYQRIMPSGDKLYLEGGRKTGCYFPLTTIDEDKSRVLLATGFATAATVREATGLPTIICFDDSNILPVLRAMKEKYPKAQFIIVADNDAFTFRNPRGDEVKDIKRQDVEGTDPRWKEWRLKGYLANSGIEKSQQAAAKVGGAPVIWPEFKSDEGKPTDFNDLSVREGLQVVKDRIFSVPKPIVKVPRKKRENDGTWYDSLLVKSMGKDGRERRLEENSYNYMMIVKNHPALEGVFAWDEFHYCTMVVSCPPWTVAEGNEADFKVHPLDEADERECDYWIQNLGFHLKGSLPKTAAAIQDAALRNRIHPARDYFNSLEWDGTPRLDSWLIDYVGCEKDDPAYVRAVGRTWIIAAVKRVYEPGCKFDHMLILEGPQSAGKSTTFKIMATFGEGADQRSYFTDTLKIANCEDPDELMKVSGRLIVEIPEMAGFGKKDNETLKAFITTTEDVYREPYGRKVKDWPRQFVLGGTYNPIAGVFTDPTGLRRYWVVTTGRRIDLEGLRRARQQIWAEAVHRYKSGESIVLSEELYQKAEVAANSRRIVDDMTMDVLRVVKNLAFFEVRDVLKALDIPIKGKSQAESFNISKILKVEGFERVQKSIAGRPTWGWQPPCTAPIQYETNFVADEEEEREIDF